MNSDAFDTEKGNFTGPMPHDPLTRRRQGVLRGILGICRGLGLENIVEGAKTLEDVAAPRAMSAPR